ncbi:MAG: hypothetical protein AAF636_12725 [Pseudomonadota bacterium]
MKNKAPIYVAETDEQGHVVWVWCLNENDKKPRAIKDRELHLQGLARATFFGAEPSKITGWFAQTNGEATTYSSRGISLKNQR